MALYRIVWVRCHGFLCTMSIFAEYGLWFGMKRRNAGFTSYPTLALHYLSITIARFEVTLELVKIKIFRAKNFNFFYKYKSENASENTAARTYITEKFSANSKNFFSQ